ncbi:hypothetical protein I6I97_12575 [Sphingobacterium multivorum]|uniref:hypothetical protein n=1 Tax=Sphingobacterium multivorum TaxID=28454 RepID=UPI0019186CD4|nr:hypothetical protein [Sphingobacterium multivorum]QQT60101.1 hypothetical protein I6I97_12575 [Sphingobacterium multivorum]
MATSTKITREVVATVTQETSKAEFNGWNLNFNIQKSGTLIKSANVYGTKSGITANVTASLSENGAINIGFSNTDFDATLANALAVELKAIKDSEAV